MNQKIATIAAGFAMIAGIAIAAVEATDPVVIAQKALMRSFGGAAKTLGGMAGGDVAFDAAAADAAKAVLIAGAAQIATVFGKPGNDPASGAKPEIWTNWDDFAVKAKALGDGAAAMDATTAGGVQAGMGAIGGACKGCHTAYRM